ncbi:unnamed protein product [Mycena citricolor]|uniref:DUF6699 domain-containing protein n=1 Tax=Mycena citricolor TaxID=2018698 RepID=A0AAD2HZ91_9AGAR|nr:unnamed protein product [Mycena citricolor]
MEDGSIKRRLFSATYGMYFWYLRIPDATCFLSMPFPSFLHHDKQPARGASLLRRFNGLYKPPPTLGSLLAPKTSKKMGKQSSTLFELAQPVCISLAPRSEPIPCVLFTDQHTPLASQDSSIYESSSSSSHSDASSSRQTLELARPVSETSAPPEACASPQRAQMRPLRPALKQGSGRFKSSSQRASTQGTSISFLFHHAPLSYDIAFPPSKQTILRRGARDPIPIEVLDEPATEPPMYTELVLHCAHFPWDIVVHPHTAIEAPASRRCGPRMPPRRRKTPITNLDIVCAVHDALSGRASGDEWGRLSTKVQRRISRSYEARCVQTGGGWDAGVRKIDWLEGRTRLVGIEMVPVKNSGQPRAMLVFKTPAA